jgi:hypothetical protein
MPPLAPGWSLGADDQQWEVLRSRQRQDEAYHQAVAFVGSTKTVLLRVLRGNGVQPTPDAQARLGCAAGAVSRLARQPGPKNDHSKRKAAARWSGRLR